MNRFPFWTNLHPRERNSKNPLRSGHPDLFPVQLRRGSDKYHLQWFGQNVKPGEIICVTFLKFGFAWLFDVRDVCDFVTVLKGVKRSGQVVFGFDKRQYMLFSFFTLPVFGNKFMISLLLRLKGSPINHLKKTSQLFNLLCLDPKRFMVYCATTFVSLTIKLCMIKELHRVSKK